MTVEAWPANLPCLLREGYNYESPDLNGTTDFLLGARRRPLYADGPDRISAFALMDAEQLAYFQGWHRFVLSNGAKWFTVRVKAAGTLESREVRIINPPRYELVGVDYFRVTLPLETRVGTTMTQAEWDALNP